MRIALVQMLCRWGDVEANLAAMDAHARAARGHGAEMVVFPELTVSGIYKDERVWELAEGLDGPSVRRVLDLARREGLFIAFGLTERARPLPYNTYCIAGPDGALLGAYRKNRVPTLEAPFWQPHGERPVFSIRGRRFAVATCFDNCDEALLAGYGRRGVELVLMPHAWDADPLDEHGAELSHGSMAELIEHWRAGRLAGWRSHDEMREQFFAYIPRRAKDNGFYALFVNQAGQPHPALRFEGPTFAVDPEGRILAQTESGEEGVLQVEVPL